MNIFYGVGSLLNN